MSIRLVLLFTVLIFTQSSFTKVIAKVITVPYAGRNFKLVIPDHLQLKNPALLVLLHGCKQDSDLILKGTGMEAEANQAGFLVLVPEQPVYDNPDHCWNWFLPIEQQRLMTTEMGQIISFMDWMIPTYSINRERVFLAGMSAGGALAHAMMACYPDYFSGVAIHSGLAFKVAETISEANSVLLSTHQKSPTYLGDAAYECGRFAPQFRLSKIIILHGLNDPRVLPLHSDLIAAANEVMLDQWDDGKRNHSDQITLTKSTQAFPNHYSANITDRTFTFPKRVVQERLIQIQGLVHAWGISGTTGVPVSPNFDPKAPSSNAFILHYFGLK